MGPSCTGYFLGNKVSQFKKKKQKKFVKVPRGGVTNVSFSPQKVSDRMSKTLQGPSSPEIAKLS